jgi:hypothetical protein
VHVTGPPIAAGPFSSTYSTVLDGGVHFTNTGVDPNLLIEPPIIIMTAIDPLTPTNALATIDFVLAQTTGAMAFEAPVLGVFDLNVTPAPPGTVPGARAIFYSSVNPADPDNNKIFTYTAGSWFTNPGETPVTGKAVSVISPGMPFTYALANIFSLFPAATVPYPFPSSVPTIGPADYTGINWWPVHVSMDHRTYPASPWPAHYFLMSNGEGISVADAGSGVTHDVINSYLDQSVQTGAAPTFKGLWLADIDADLTVTSINEKEVQGSVNVGVGALFDTLLAWAPPTDGVWTVVVSTAGVQEAGGGGNYSSFAHFSVVRTLGTVSAPTMIDFYECKSGSMSTADYTVTFVQNLGLSLDVMANTDGVVGCDWRCSLTAICSA